MATTTRPTAAPALTMQGIAIPAESVNPAEFFARTRRHTATEKTVTYAGQSSDTIELRKSDILSTVLVRFVGSLVVAHTTGTVATTARWAQDLVKQFRFTANGASNLINCSGGKLKVRDIMKRGDISDRGVSQTFGGSAITQGSLALASESWGVGSNTSGIAAGTYDVELEWIVPVAEDEQDLAGAIFLQTSTSDLTLQMDYSAPSELFVLTGDGTATLTGSFTVATTKFSIPVGSNGGIVVPDLSLFHSIIQSRTTALQVGENETRIVGQGAGKSLLRIFWQVWNGTPAVPLVQSAANFGKQIYRYGNNESPEEILDGRHMRVMNERQYNSDIGGVFGFGCFDFVQENAFRDVIDLGTTSEFRLVNTINSGVTLSNQALEYVTEVVFQAGQAA